MIVIWTHFSTSIDSIKVVKRLQGEIGLSFSLGNIKKVFMEELAFKRGFEEWKGSEQLLMCHLESVTYCSYVIVPGRIK